MSNDQAADALVLGSAADPREPEAAAADAELQAHGTYVPPEPLLGQEDRNAGIMTPDMLASAEEVAGARTAVSELGGTGAAGGAAAAAAEAARSGRGEGEVPPVLADVAEKPHPGTGSSRVGALPGADQYVDPQTEKELAAASLPGA